jgi:hypothetical protein
LAHFAFRSLIAMELITWSAAPGGPGINIPASFCGKSFAQGRVGLSATLAAAHFKKELKKSLFIGRLSA